jgi:predicted ATP-grasp superfamily ATP-dependent carboligase
VRGVRVVYARRALHMPVLDWPSWASDRPTAGERIDADAPLCTVHASGRDVDAVEARLRERADALVSLLGGLSAEAA